MNAVFRQHKAMRGDNYKIHCKLLATYYITELKMIVQKLDTFKFK